MRASIQRQGMNATGLNQVLHDAGAPKGVLYHHFPGGKTALTVAAIDASVVQLSASLARAVARTDDVLDSLERWLVRSAEALRSADFERGCPLATVALESAPGDTDIRAALAAGFGRMRDIIAEQLAAQGRTSAEAERAAFAIVAAYEGGLLQARVSGDIEPMVRSCRYLLDLMRAGR
jgi:TetR/AcrR family transcriptional repressor of lmrAB and yxaGH operons